MRLLMSIELTMKFDDSDSFFHVTLKLTLDNKILFNSLGFCNFDLKKLIINKKKFNKLTKIKKLFLCLTIKTIS